MAPVAVSLRNNPRARPARTKPAAVFGAIEKKERFLKEFVPVAHRASTTHPNRPMNQLADSEQSFSHRAGPEDSCAFVKSVTRKSRRNQTKQRVFACDAVRWKSKQVPRPQLYEIESGAPEKFLTESIKLK
jgi:hypothetical protein